MNHCLNVILKLLSPPFTGLGPGGLTITKLDFPLSAKCVPGSSHGGKALSEEPSWLDSGPPYDKQNITSLLGGSGGKVNVVSYPLARAHDCNV